MENSSGATEVRGPVCRGGDSSSSVTGESGSPHPAWKSWLLAAGSRHETCAHLIKPKRFICVPALRGWDAGGLETGERRRPRCVKANFWCSTHSGTPRVMRAEHESRQITGGEPIRGQRLRAAPQQVGRRGREAEFKPRG